MNDIQKTDAKILETVMMGGDLSPLTSEQRMTYYVQVCESMKLNPLTKPFDYLKLNGKLVLYANKNCAEQIRQTRAISLTLPEKKIDSDVYIVTARAEAGGRTDEATGAVSLEHLKGEQRANAIMKAETKAKRRVTLSFAGLGMLDESEIESIPDAEKVAEKDITPEPFKARPETLKAQEQWEKDTARMAKLPDDINTINACAASDIFTQDIEDFQPPEPPPQPEKQPLKGKPENVAAQAQWERDKLQAAEREKIAKNKKRWDALPKDIREGFAWTKDSVDQIISVLDTNNNDPVQIRAYLEDKGWRGSADLSDVAAQAMPEAG